MAGNRIYYQYPCDCDPNGQTVKVKINENQDLKGTEPVYFTCTKCNTTFAVDPVLVLPEGRIITTEEKERLDSVEDYAIDKTYVIGQTIYHPDFKEKGVVMSRKEASGYAGKLLVNFEKRGKVYLVEGYPKK